MSWQEVTPVTRREAAPKLVAKIRCSPSRGIAVLINEALRAELGWIVGQTTLRLLVGRAESEGRIRLEPITPGPLAFGAIGKGGGLVRVGFWDEVERRKLKAARCEWTAIGETAALELTLPPELQRPRVGGPAVTPPVPQRAPKQPPTLGGLRGEVAPAKPLGPPRDLTAALMGDPPPERSAAAQRKGKGRGR